MIYPLITIFIKAVLKTACFVYSTIMLQLLGDFVPRPYRASVPGPRSGTSVQRLCATEVDN